MRRILVVAALLVGVMVAVRRLALVVGLTAVSVFLLTPPVMAQEAPPPLVGEFAPDGYGVGEFQFASHITLDHEGNLLALAPGTGDRDDPTASYESKILRYSPSGEFLGEFGYDPNSSFDPFHTPRDFDVDASGNIYVADNNGNAVEVLASDGTELRSINVENGPTCVGVLGSEVYVNEHSELINVYSTAGTFLRMFNEDDCHEMEFESSGNVYTLSHEGFGKYSLLKWNPAGEFQSRVQAAGYGMSIDSQDTVYVADGTNGITRFSDNGEDLGFWTMPQGTDPEENDAPAKPLDVAVDSDTGMMYVLYTSQTVNGYHVLKYDLDVIAPEVLGYGPTGRSVGLYAKPYVRYGEVVDLATYQLYRKRPDGTWRQVALTSTSATDVSEIRLIAENYPLERGTWYKAVTRAWDGHGNSTYKAWRFKTRT
jgi:hypothetical protein